MKQVSTLGKWITEKYRSQVIFAEKVGAHPTMVSRWLSGREGISPDYRDKIRGMKYAGPWPQDEAQEVPEPGAAALTRDDFMKAMGAMETRLKDLESVIQDLGEGLRAAIPSMPPQPRPGAQKQ